MRTFFALVTALALVGCASRGQLDSHPPDAASDHGLVKFYDRNQDGHVDYEWHDFGCCDRNWALVDTDFSGRYDLELRWGISFERLPADSPVATGVSISSEDPPGPHM